MQNQISGTAALLKPLSAERTFLGKETGQKGLFDEVLLAKIGFNGHWILRNADSAESETGKSNLLEKMIYLVFFFAINLILTNP